MYIPTGRRLMIWLYKDKKRDKVAQSLDVERIIILINVISYNASRL